MYDHSSLLIVGLLFLGLLIAIEIGFRLGNQIADAASDSARAQVNTIQASLLGVLALLLGFTFSLALQRYDARSVAVVTESNAIGTAVLRAELLPEPHRDQARDALSDYLDLRIQAASISLDRVDERDELLDRTAALQNRLWQLGRDAAQDFPNPVQTGLFVQALNDLIDTYGSRNAALDRHVPEIVLFLLFGTFALTACLVGFSSGISGNRASFPTYILVVLITFLVFIIIDLDRPRRGLIEVSQKSLIELRAEP